MELSVISPCYGAPTLLRELVRQIEESVRELTPDYEIILVEDCSPDNSREIITDICRENKRVKGVFLSRNFGQQYALNAGFDLSSGEYVAVLDCDLQNPPMFLRDLYRKMQEGYDIVFASRQERPDNYFMTEGSHLFNRLMGYLTDTPQDESVAEFAMYRRKVVNAMAMMGDYRRYYPLMDKWVGFRTAKVEVPHDARTDGKESSYTMRRRIGLAVQTAVAFSTKSLRLIAYFGFLITLIAMIVAIALVIKTLVTGIDVSGWVTTFVSMWFIAGIIISILGIIAVYIGNIFDEVKRRPSYIVGEKLNFDESQS
jgi:dolichol-phosphate mannosyltransferase